MARAHKDEVHSIHDSQKEDQGPPGAYKKQPDIHKLVNIIIHHYLYLLLSYNNDETVWLVIWIE